MMRLGAATRRLRPPSRMRTAVLRRRPFSGSTSSSSHRALTTATTTTSAAATSLLLALGAAGLTLSSSSSSSSSKFTAASPTTTAVWCEDDGSGKNASDLKQLSSSGGKEHAAVADLIVPSLQALLRALRLLGTTGLIVLDYEWFKWQQKAIRFLQQANRNQNKDLNHNRRPTTTTPTTTAAPLSKTDNDHVDLSSMTKTQQQDYWEHEVKRRHDIFEKAQIAYTTPSSKQQQQEDSIPKDMTRETLKKQQKQAMKEAAAAWMEAEEELKKIGGSHISQIHTHAAERLVNLCRTNAGVYIKIGQHLANMDYLIPQEYIQVLGCLLDDAPTSSYESVSQVIQDDLGQSPEELFDNFDPTPIASASLAQVHVAYDKTTGRKLAVKVQHKGLRETCRGDLLALTTVVHALEFFLEDFNFGWIADEIAPQLPLELDFQNEGKNSERAARFLQQRQHTNNDVVVPKVLWNHTSSRVLCMEFEEGFRATNVDMIRSSGMSPRDAAQLISRVFHSQVFLDAFVHCDPHPAVSRKNY